MALTSPGVPGDSKFWIIETSEKGVASNDDTQEGNDFGLLGDDSG